MANFAAQDYIKRVNPTYTLLKAVRIRPSDQPKYPGGLDEWLTVVANLDDKEIYCVAYFPSYISDNVTVDKIERDPYTANMSFTDYVKKKLGRKWPDKIASETALLDEILGIGLKNQQGTINDYKIIQDPLDTNVVPPQEVKEVKKVDNPSQTNNEGLPTTQAKETQAGPAKTIEIRPDQVRAKLKIAKKSGPGEIAGNLEIEVSRQGDQFGATFNDLQFTEPGDYVLSITSDSPYVAATEYTIKILPEKIVVEQEEKKEDKEPSTVEGTKPNIAQIDRPDIKLPPMRVEYETMDKSVKEVGEGVGYFPFLMYNGAFVGHNEILSFRLYHDGIVPKCQVSFSDTLGLIKDVGTPKDDSTFEIFINSRSINLKSIHLSFKIERFRDSKSGAKYSMVGTLNIPGLNDFYQQVFGDFEGTSYNAIREMSRKLGLGFNSNIDDTDDKMKWVFNGNKRYQIMEEIIKKSYISDTSFVGAYIDFYYCMNFVDVEKECKRDISSDVGIETGGITTTTDGLEENITNMLLHNEATQNKSAFYYLSEPKIKHNNTIKNLLKGYRTKIKFYDNIKKKFEVFDIEGTTGDGQETTILKGKEMDKENFIKNFTTRYIGKIDTENVHKNYLYAEELNRRNLDELGNLEMTIRMPNINLNYYLYQKVRLILVNARPTATNTSPVRYEYSGAWTIAAIELRMVEENSLKTFFQEMKLIRKELGKTPDEIANSNIESKDTDNRKQNTNTVDELANSKYKENSVYRFVDKDQREWIVQIVAQNFDGNSVIAYIASVDEQKTQ